MPTAPFRIEIFRTGTHTDSSGREIEISNYAVDEAIANHDPAQYRVPLIVSHDTGDYSDTAVATSELAHGIASYFERIGNKVYAVFKDKIAPKFKTWVEQGRLHSISASFYLPDSPNNPYPGQFSFRHIAALGKSPPAVKGLEPIQLSACFTSNEAGAVNFSMPYMYGIKGVATVLSSLRDWLITEKDLKTAEDHIPHELIVNLLREPEYASFDDIEHCMERCAELEHMIHGKYHSVLQSLAHLEDKLCRKYDDMDYPHYSEFRANKHTGVANMGYRKCMNKMSSSSYGGDMKKLAKGAGIEYEELEKMLDGEVEMKESHKKQLADAMDMELVEFKKHLKHDAEYEAAELREEVIRLQLEKRRAQQINFVQAAEAEHRITPALRNPLPVEFTVGSEKKSEKLPLVEFMASLNDRQLSFMRAFIERLPQQGDIQISSFTTPLVTAADGDDEASPLNFTEIGERAKALATRRRAEGISMTESQAVDEIIRQHGVAQ